MHSKFTARLAGLAAALMAISPAIAATPTPVAPEELEALQRPLPTLTAPVPGEAVDQAAFDEPAPPPPPIDLDYRPPGH
jgi:hypothetical protein